MKRNAATHKYMLATRIDQLALSTRTRNVLQSEGLLRVADLMIVNETDLLRVPRIGAGTVTEIRNALATLGLTIKAGG